MSTSEPPSGSSEEAPEPSRQRWSDPTYGESSTGSLAASQDISVADPSGPPSPLYPASLEISYPHELNRWLPLVKWLLVIPHFIALFFVGIGASFVLIYAFVVVLFTGR